MIKDWLAEQGLLIAPTIALILFIVIFVLMVIWIYRPGSKKTYEEKAWIPLDGQKEQP